MSNEIPYAVISDIHCHDWTLFSKTDPDGVNSRLRITLNEIERAAQELLAKGGNRLIVAGDIFHSRGKIDPEVLNPTRDCFQRVVDMGVIVHAIPGNHDLKTRDTRALSSAIQNLSEITAQDCSTVNIYNEPSLISEGDNWFGFVPWCNTHEELHAALEKIKKDAPIPSVVGKTDVFIHAGIDGVLSGTPASGLTASQLATYGFRRVFAGHYHNHADLGQGIYSIGATTHHNWGDVNTRAGFLMVDNNSVTFNDTLAPKFEDLTGLDEIEMEMTCGGSYVRFSGPEMTQPEIDALRQQFLDWGALGVMIQVPKKTAQGASAAPVKGQTLEQSLCGFVDSSTTIPASVDKEKVKARALEVLKDVQSVTEAV